MISRPSAAEERLMAAGAPVEWRTFPILPRIGFFVLAAICMTGLSGFLYATTRSPQASSLITAVLAFALAEYLIIVRRFFRAGFDEAIWVAGALSLANVFSWMQGWRADVALIAVAFLAAAIRLLNPFFATLGLLLLPIVAIDDNRTITLCYASLAVIALTFLPFPRRRPSMEQTLGALAVVMPVPAYLTFKELKFHFDPSVAAALLLYAIAALIVGVRFRLHAPLLALFTTLGCFAYEVREVSGLSLEARLIVWGSGLLAASVLIERFLKTPWRGITSRQLKDDQLGDLLQLAGTVAIAPHEVGAHSVRPEGGPQVETGGGSSFGGAGAGGDF